MIGFFATPVKRETLEKLYDILKGQFKAGGRRYNHHMKDS